MPKLNKYIVKLKKDYFFNEIKNKAQKLKEKKPNLELLNLGIGDVTIPVSQSVVNAICDATKELLHTKTLKGYGPTVGYDFLKHKIIANDYKNMDISLDEIFISNGVKYTSANLSDLFCTTNTVAISDPAYPIYVDTNLMQGREIKYIPLLQENNFEAIPLKESVDLVYLCSPNNPTGVASSYENLKSWIDYAKNNNSLIILDGAYEAYITSENIPKSIYEIPSAKDVAIEMRSFSKTAGFTSLRCSYMVIPKNIKIKYENNHFSLNSLWKRYIDTKLGNISYPIQKGAEAVYSPQGKKEIQANIQTYLENTKLLKKALQKIGFNVYGGTDSPYVWCQTKDNMSSWDFFDLLLNKANIIALPGSGFGKAGEGYIRFSGFAKSDDINQAVENIKNI